MRRAKPPPGRFQPADFSRAVGDLHPVVVRLQNGKFRAVVRRERALRIVKRPAARRRRRRPSPRRRIGKMIRRLQAQHRAEENGQPDEKGGRRFSTRDERRPDLARGEQNSVSQKATAVSSVHSLSVNWPGQFCQRLSRTVEP